ncbi:MAG TPA: DoxX family protein [Gemmatimonadaceae bacterium]|nr:DoxX family protein [Gemmatimonadaceae bacterium]
MTSISLTRRDRSTTGLWIAQSVLAALFLFAGGFKLVLPAAALAAQSHMPGAFIKFIGVCETLGALGLILPGLFHVQERLTSLAASGLVIIMIGAVVTTILQGQGPAAILPAVVGAIAVYVARGRAR